MTRLLASLALIVCISYVQAGDAPLERQLALQKAMATARQYLEQKMSAEALSTLEAEVMYADGNKAFLDLLREAYLGELGRLGQNPDANAARLSEVRRNLALLGGSVPVAIPAPARTPTASLEGSPALPSLEIPTPTRDTSAEAAAAFKKGDYSQAEKLYAAAGAARLSSEQKAAWAYCRVRLGAERVNAGQCDAAAAKAVQKDVAEALELAPQNAELHKFGQQVLASAARKAHGKAEPAVAATGDVYETPSFRVRHTGNRELAESIGKLAETSRKTIYERWSGPPSGAWEPKCEIVIHGTAEAYVQATSRPSGSTGNATVRLTNGRPTERRIDLRADDAGMSTNSLPRELTHVVLADLFPDHSPPKWAEEGMAVLAGSSEEAGRYTRTLRRCAREGEWIGLAQLMDLKEFPAEKITGFYCESVSLTEYLIRQGGGERNFTIFLRDCQRYGTAQSLKRQYGIEGPQALEAVWKRHVLEASR
jgi:tetratricopeptide (TPR) repeat protein